MRDENYYIKKNRRKILRVVIQIIVLIGVAYLIINASFNLKKYQNDQLKSSGIEDNGFIAISYFGVDKTGDETLISSEQLNDHIKALKKSGYVTINQQDILDYYQKGTKLPKKSLFLIFEDGRRDTAIFAQEIMEKNNVKATMLTYADKFEKKDPKFLSPEDLIQLEESTFWELGTNGYRLEYINTFDRYENFIGQLKTLEFADVSPYLDRNYNHYLMDYIRDENDIPLESYKEMKVRISDDYKLLQEVYQNKIDKVPNLYILMHSNTGQYGTNDKVSAINAQWITDIFDMNFNREGDALNSQDTSIYDLTRLQPQSYWSTNHFLMKIKDDTQQNVVFVSGDVEEKSYWNTMVGESEFKAEEIILTSLPESRGLMSLKESESYKNLDLSVFLKGNKVGLQKIYLRADKELNQALSVELNNNQLNIMEKLQGVDNLLFSIDLDQLDGIASQSIEENKKSAEIEEIRTKIRYADNVEAAKARTIELNEKLKEIAPSINDGAQKYEPTLDIKEGANRYLQLSLIDDKLSVWVDNKIVIENLHIQNNSEGFVLLESAWGGYGYSQRNLSDDVYDGIFEKLIIKSPASENDEVAEKLLYDNCLHGLYLFFYTLENKYNAVINWFIKTL